MSRAYLKGMLHDATERDYTYRISQNHRQFVEELASMIQKLGFKSWTYEEGDRGVYVVEFSKKAVEGFEVASREDEREYVRGYFDAEGSVPTNPNTRFYIYLAQKDCEDLEEAKRFIENLGIDTGKLHRPSKSARPEYWRFYISSRSHERFAEEIGSRHPRKRQLLREMRQSTP